MKNLISMVAFVISQNFKLVKGEIDINQCGLSILKYANFILKPLELWMFVPCKLVEGVWVVLEEPIKYKNWTNFDYSGTDIGFEDEKLCREYQQAKERCLFDGCTSELNKSNNYYIIKFDDESNAIKSYNDKLKEIMKEEIF